MTMKTSRTRGGRLVHRLGMAIGVAALTAFGLAQGLLTTAAASADGPSPASDPREVQTAATAGSPDLIVQMSSDATGALRSRDRFTYSVVVTNVGEETAHGVHVYDGLPPGLRVINLLPTMTGGTCTVTSSIDDKERVRMTVDCRRATLEPLDTATLTIDVQVDDTASCGEIVNRTEVEADDEPRLDVNAANRAAMTNQIVCVPSIALEARSPSLAHVGDNVEYTFAVRNDGEADLADVQLVDPGCDGAPARVHGDATSLSVGRTWWYRCTHVITAGEGDPVTSRATVSATDEAGREVHATERHVVDVIHPSLRIATSVEPTSGTPGDTVIYRYTMSNTGDTPLFHVVVKDDAVGPAGHIDRLPPGATETLSAAFVLPADEVAIVNVATARGHDVLDRVVSDEGRATVTVVAGTGGRGDGAGGPADTAGPVSGTAFTGADAGGPVAAATVLACLGIGLVALSRRRHRPGG